MKVIIILVISTLLSGFQVNQIVRPQNKRNVTAGELREWVSYLASDQMQGRRNGSPEMKVAASWIEGKFREYGLKGAFENGVYVQEYTAISRQRQFSERNVVGFIEGSDPELKNEYLILSAHFDHIGVRPGNLADSVCNGADDNAAGTCALIGIAKIISNSDIRPGRSIIIAAFSGEESGMRGSRHFVSTPSVPLKNIVANLNFEMIGHSELLGRNNYYMTGCLNSNLDDIIKGFKTTGEVQLIDTVKKANQLFFSSDNIAFSRISAAGGHNVGIPSGTFATSTNGSHVHTVDDEVELFDFENMANLVNYFGEMILWLSNTDKEIRWTDPAYSRPD